MACVFKPYKWLSDIRFGQEREAVERILGEPQKVKRTYTGKTRLEYNMSMPAFVFADGELFEMNLLPDVSRTVRIQGDERFAMPEDKVLRQLEQDDPTCECQTASSFFRLGHGVDVFP